MTTTAQLLDDAEHDRNRRTNRYVCTCTPRPNVDPCGECRGCRKLRTDRLACFWHAQRRATDTPTPATVIIDGLPFCAGCADQLGPHDRPTIHLQAAT